MKADVRFLVGNISLISPPIRLLVSQDFAVWITAQCFAFDTVIECASFATLAYCAYECGWRLAQYLRYTSHVSSSLLLRPQYNLPNELQGIHKATASFSSFLHIEKYIEAFGVICIYLIT